MGFGSKIKKAVKGVGKAVKKVAAPAATAIGGFFGGPVGAAVGRGVGGLISGMGGSKELSSGLGDAVGGGITQGVQNLFDGFAQSLDPQGSQVPGVPSGVANVPTGDMSEGMGFIKGMETPIKSATEQGKDTKDYLAAAYPELNPWERSGTGGTMFGSDMTSAVQSQEANNKQLASTMALQKMQTTKDLALAKLASDTQLAINQNNNMTALEQAGIASQTSRLNTRDQVGIGQQNVELGKQRLDMDITRTAASNSLTYQQKEESIARTIKTHAETNNVKLSAGQIKAMTQQALASAGESGARTSYVGQQTKTERERTKGQTQANDNARYGNGAIINSIYSGSNMIMDAWDSMWNNSGGVSGPMSRP